ncbi:unnamed protein product [Acanthoscelides obtectus]|uniref:Uncharacterized protein n=1 Tax=Acanthoscelides obtectus TaxID=200917 RepID=A0A9P0Q527_ACAOB|nr:unnamed protein product [Acanthoscelides obtectus]CAK1652158.1 hypothetical protein AOBTE_LOCUS17718 [Acanthoscelides obtectus]
MPSLLISEHNPLGMCLQKTHTKSIHSTSPP